MDQSLSSLSFKGSIIEAITEAKQQKKLFVVYLAGDNPESKDLETSTWTDANVSEVLTKYCILLHILEGSSEASQFSAIYPQNSSPSITAVGYNGVQLWQTEGFVTAEVLASSLEKAWLSLHVQTIGGPNATNIPVALPLSGSLSPTLFGLVSVLDNPLRTAPNNHSEIVGQMQGSITLSSLEEFSLHMSVDLVFTGGEYNGSTLSVMGHNPYLNNIRTVSIVGGTGDFQLARGLLVVQTVFFDNPPGVNFFELNATVLHHNGSLL